MNHGIKKLLQESATAMAENYGLNMMNPDNALAVLSDKDGALQEAIDLQIAEAGFNDEEAAQFRQFAENTAEDFVVEATTAADIKPYASFQITMLKELFSRSIGRHLVRNEVLASTSEKFGTFETVLIDAAGNRIKLSEMDMNTTVDEGWKQKLVAIATTAAGMDLFSSTYLTSAEDQAVANKVLDVATGIVSVTLTDGTTDTIVPLVAKFNEYGTMNVYVEGTVDGVLTKDRIYGIVDYKTGAMTLQSEDSNVKDITIEYRLSNVYAETSDLELELDYTETRVDIDDGKLINLSIPMNYLQDIKAYTTVDGMTKAIEKISTAFTTLNDRDILNTIAANVDGDTTRQTSFDYDLPAGISRVDWNSGLLDAVNRAIAISDNNTQFSTVTSYNIACNPVDASTVTSPVILQNPTMVNPSVTGGSMTHQVVPMISVAGTVNFLSTKIVSKSSMYVVPKTASEDERVVGNYLYSNILITDSSYRNRRSPNIKNIAARERKQIHIHEGSAISKVNILNNA